MHAYAGPVLVTLAYVLIYYLMQTNQLRVKTKLKREYHSRGEKFDRYFGNDREMLAADRYVGNTLEHMGPFLILLWLTAVFAGTGHATAAGAVYVVCRAGYPFAMGTELGKSVPTSILLSTVPAYLALTYLAARTALAVFG